MTAWLGLARAGCVLTACSMLLAAPASAQDALKDLLGKAQSEAQQQQVEDLIRKLQSKRAAPPAATAAPPAATPAPAPATPQEPPPAIEARPAPGASPAPAKTEPKQEVAKEVAPAAPPAAAQPPPAPGVADEATVAAAKQAVEEADKNELPSIDLEVYFDAGSTDVSPEAAAALTPLGRALADPRLAEGTFLIAGHSDAYGPARYNLRLSQKRAESVREFLIDKFGIKPERLVAQGFGEERPKNPRSPRASENRRVQIVNMGKQASR